MDTVTFNLSVKVEVHMTNDGRGLQWRVSTAFNSPTQFSLSTVFYLLRRVWQWIIPHRVGDNNWLEQRCDSRDFPSIHPGSTLSESDDGTIDGEICKRGSTDNLTACQFDQEDEKPSADLISSPELFHNLSESSRTLIYSVVEPFICGSSTIIELLAWLCQRCIYSPIKYHKVLYISSIYF